MKKLVLAICFLAIVAFWGATFLIVQRATHAYSVLGFLALRFGIATLCVAPFAVRQADRSVFSIGVPIGLILAAAYLFQTYGLQSTTSTNSGLITGMFIVFVPWMNRLLFGARTGLWPWLGIVVSVIGLLLLTGHWSGWQPGDFLTLVCAACFGLQVTLLDHYAPKHRATSLALGQLLAVTIACLIAWLVLEHDTLSWPTTGVWAAIAATGIVGSALAVFVQALAQKQLSAIETAMILMAEPVFAALTGRYWGGELLSGGQWLSALLIMAALGFVALQPLWDGLRRDHTPRRSAEVAVTE